MGTDTGVQQGRREPRRYTVGELFTLLRKGIEGQRLREIERGDMESLAVAIRELVTGGGQAVHAFDVVLRNGQVFRVRLEERWPRGEGDGHGAAEDDEEDGGGGYGRE